MPSTYTVAPGDTLSAIGAKFGVNYQDIAKANNIANPNLIYPGQTFTIPGAGPPAPAPTAQAVAPQATQQPQQTAPQQQSAPSGGGDTELQQLAKTQRNPVQETRYQELLKGQGGAGGATSTIGAKPTIDLTAITNAAYNTPEIQKANQAITDRQKALADATTAINDNPFYSEATRVGKLAKLEQSANDDIRVQQDILAGLKADAAIKVNTALGQYNIDNEAYQQKLSQFNNLLNAGALDNASGSDLETLAAETGIPISMIQSMAKVSKQKNTPVDKPQIVQATDNEGNLTLLAVGSDGTIVNQTTIPGAGKAAKETGGTSASDQKAADLEANKANLVTDVKAKARLQDLVNYYGSVLNINDIYALYNQFSPWGPATETIQQVKQGLYQG